LGQKPGLGDEENVKNFLDMFEMFLSKQKFLAGDNMTIAGESTASDFFA